MRKARLRANSATVLPQLPQFPEPRLQQVVLPQLPPVSGAAASAGVSAGVSAVASSARRRGWAREKLCEGKDYRY